MERIRISLEDLNKGHQAVIGAVNAVLVSLRDYSQSRPGLQQLNEQLAAYFRYQGREFYAFLHECHAAHRHTIKVLEFLESDLRDIKIKYAVFCDRFAAPFTNEAVWRNFPREFSEVARELLARLKIEKEYLVPILERLPCAEPESDRKPE